MMEMERRDLLRDQGWILSRSLRRMNPWKNSQRMNTNQKTPPCEVGGVKSSHSQSKAMFVMEY
ncbi:unnamed protein product [Leuciscus chuanchicus]